MTHGTWYGETKKAVSVESLGLCEHCGQLMTIKDFPVEAMNAVWKCPKCDGVLSHLSFGYESDEGEKIKWVDPNKKWVDKKPTENFKLEKFEVIMY